MNYDPILKEIKPNPHERANIKKLVKKLIAILDDLSRKNNINSKAVLVGSIAKGTWLSGKADIDIFINFPLETSFEDLKKNGLFLGYECIKEMGGSAEERFASHPYVTGRIEGYEIDFVPCYSIKSAEELKSAVDRTILHNTYIQEKLKARQIDEVLLLKKFMDSVECYGSEFKVGGFSGYLCELLILRYDSFEGVLEAAAQDWKPGMIIDIENHGTGERFKEAMVVVDPIDENRNVAAALTLERMAEFVTASRNFLKSPCEEYFSRVSLDVHPPTILRQFKKRGTETIIISFKPPKIPPDAIYPQLKKTTNSITRKVKDEGFIVDKSSYWTNEIDLAFFILELRQWYLPEYRKHEGPQIWNKIHQKKFIKKYGPQAWLEEDRWMVELSRKYRDIYSFLDFILREENLQHLKTGKNLKEQIVKSYKISDIEEFLDHSSEDILNFLYKFLNPGRHLWRYQKD